MDAYEHDPSQVMEQAIRALPHGAPLETPRAFTEIETLHLMAVINQSYSPEFRERIKEIPGMILNQATQNDDLHIDPDGLHISMSIYRLRGLLGLAAASGALQTIGMVGNAINGINRLNKEFSDDAT